jgi:hypothetical protein
MKHTKHTLTAALLLAATSFTQAQLQVSTKIFDLETAKLEKSVNIIDAGVDKASQKIFVKFATPVCDASKKSSVSFSPGTITTTTTTYFKGLDWTINTLNFDKDFTFQNTEEKKYTSTKEAILNNEKVFGKKFMPISGDGLGTMLGGIAAPTAPVDYSYMFTKIVSGIAGIGGFKIGASFIGLSVNGNVSKTRGTSCNELPTIYKYDNIPAKEEKGQRWIPMFNQPIPNGGHILFNTSGVNKENKQHFVFRKYDEFAQVVKDKAFTFDYQCIPYMGSIDLGQGKFDYVLVTLPIDYKKSDLKVNPANQYEYFRIDGTTFEVKEQFSITAPLSQWKINQVVEKNGVIYLIGDAGKAADVHQDFSIPKPSDFPNFQVAKIVNGKLAHISAYKADDFKAALVTTQGEKFKGEFNCKAGDVQIEVVNHKLVYSGYQTDNGQRGDAMITAVFGNDGKLEAFVSKNEEYAKANMVFSNDGKKMYWLIQDYTEYNKTDKKINYIYPKEAKKVLTALSVVTYNIDAKTATYQTFKNEEWGIENSNNILYDNEQEVLLLGSRLTKKAKESELVFISIKK